MQPPWELFKVVSLVENHRQEKDRDYADLLNRMRLGEHTDNDIAKLQARVRPENHPDVAGMDILVVAASQNLQVCILCSPEFWLRQFLYNL